MSLETLNKRLAAVPKAARQAVQPSLQKSGLELVAAMQTLAEPSRDTGDLIASIEMTPGGEQTPAYSQPGGSQTVPDNAVMITAGNTDVRYPHLVEYGTAKAAAQPFFWPAFRLLRRRLQNRTKRAIGRAVRESWAK
jgi:HK97 gp10 family phage protein